MRNHTDIRVQSETHPIAEKPEGEGWNIWSGNSTHSEWYRIVKVDYEGKIESVLSHKENWGRVQYTLDEALYLKALKDNSIDE